MSCFRWTGLSYTLATSVGEYLWMVPSLNPYSSLRCCFSTKRTRQAWQATHQSRRGVASAGIRSREKGWQKSNKLARQLKVVCKIHSYNFNKVIDHKEFSLMLFYSLSIPVWQCMLYHIQDRWTTNAFCFTFFSTIRPFESKTIRLSLLDCYKSLGILRIKAHLLKT